MPRFLKNCCCYSGSLENVRFDTQELNNDNKIFMQIPIFRFHFLQFLLYAKSIYSSSFQKIGMRTFALYAQQNFLQKVGCGILSSKYC